MADFHVIVEDDSPYQIDLVAVRCGKDLNVAITGGSSPHVGAVALGVDETFMKGREERGASVSVISAFAHRDEAVARAAAKELASALKCNVSVSAGVHIDNASESDIEHLLDNCHRACETLIFQLT